MEVQNNTVQEIELRKEENESETIYLEVVEDNSNFQFNDTEIQVTQENCATSSQILGEQLEGNLHYQKKENVTPTGQIQSGVKRQFQKWNPATLKKSISSELNGMRRKNVVTKLQAAEKVKTLTESKNILIQLQTDYLRNEMAFKEEENSLKIKKLEEDIKNAKMEGELKEIEKRIKQETLKKILQGTAFNI